MEQFRAHIANGEYAAASVLWEQFAADVEQRLRAGAVSPAEWAEVSELYSWSRGVMLCARAHALEMLNANHVANAYGRVG